jgi:hypothetical protein
MIGDVFRMTSWSHVESKMRLQMGCRDKKQVAVMLLLGYEDKDGSRSLDLERAMNDLGWVRTKSRKKT